MAGRSATAMSRRTGGQMVPGEGPLPCLALILGEAPGKVETQLGRPFVGPSGAFLDQALHLLDFDRSEAYITNVVKEWPRNEVGATRRPTNAEIVRWQPVFKEELEACSPGAVLLLGKTAAESWGYTPELAESNIFTAWHPAFVLRKMQTDSEIVSKWFFQLNPFIQTVKDLRQHL